MKQTVLLWLGIILAVSACNKQPTHYKGIIQTIENGKDGYVATLKNEEGENFEAIFSIPNMGAQFMRYQTGDTLRIKGDTIHINQTFRVIARQAQKQ